ncbi:MAG: hypothetical protein JO057_11665 [Chloroflexi bacterium]|nr:hypothetical protein [Chloroflexota bacterium]
MFHPQALVSPRPCPPPTRSGSAPPDEGAEALSFALRYEGRRRVHHADDARARITITANITANRLVERLAR